MKHLELENKILKGTVAALAARLNESVPWNIALLPTNAVKNFAQAIEEMALTRLHALPTKLARLGPRLTQQHIDLIEAEYEDYHGCYLHLMLCYTSCKAFDRTANHTPATDQLYIDETKRVDSQYRALKDDFVTADKKLLSPEAIKQMGKEMIEGAEKVSDMFLFEKHGCLEFEANGYVAVLPA